MRLLLLLAALSHASTVKDTESAGVSASPAGAKVGRLPSDKSFQGKYFVGIVEMLTNDMPAGGRSEGPMTTIIKFINEEGCRQDASGARIAVDVKDYKDGIKRSLERTEVVFVTRAEMNKLQPKAGAFGVTAEFKGAIGLNIGSKGKNTLAIVVPLEQKTPDPADGVMVGAHEALHIILPGFGNPALGGGPKLPESGSKAIAFEHHRLTDYLHWFGTYAQAPAKPWTPPDQMPSCKP